MEKKASVAMTLVIASMWVAGCSSADGEQTAASAETPGAVSAGEETPQAFVFESGTLEIGDFDPQALGDDLFDPCTEISAAEFAAAGFENVEPMPEEYTGLAHGMSVCEIYDASGQTHSDFSANNANRAHVETQVEILPYLSKVIPSLFVYGPRAGSEIHCFAQVDTARGGISAGVTDASNNRDLTRMCNEAIEMLEKLYLEHSR